MLLYCPQCQNLVEKISEDHSEGDTITKQCSRCGRTVEYYVKYKPVGKIIYASDLHTRI